MIITIPDGREITVELRQGERGNLMLAFEADRDIQIDRSEVAQKRKREARR